MRVIARRKEEQNRAAIDPWTAIHLTSGMAFGLTDIPFRWAIGLSVAYEVVEQYAERRGWGKSFFRTAGPESLPNAVVDIVVFAVGHRLGARWNATGSPPGKRD